MIGPAGSGRGKPALDGDAGKKTNQSGQKNKL
jgi:hypothetical protein